MCAVEPPRERPVLSTDMQAAQFDDIGWSDFQHQ
jgi:hypothetical protein